MKNVDNNQTSFYQDLHKTLTQSNTYPVFYAVIRVLLAIITFSAQLYLCIEVILKFKFFGLFNLLFSAKVAATLLLGAQLLLSGLMFVVLGFYFFQAPVGFIKSERRKALGIITNGKKRSLANILSRVAVKQSKFFAHYGLSQFNDLVKEKAVNGLNKSSDGPLMAQLKLIEYHTYIQALLELAHVQCALGSDDEYAQALGETEQPLNVGTKKGPQLRGQVQDELVAFVRRWLESTNRTPVHRDQITTRMQTRVFEYLKSIQTALATLQTVDKLELMRKGIAANFEHKVIKLFPAKQPWYTRIWQGIAKRLGVINAMANSVIFSCVCYDLLVAVSRSVLFIPTMGIYFGFLLAMASGYYISISFTFQNVKKFIKSLQFNQLPIYIDNDKGRLNLLLGSMMGIASGVFCYSRVMKLLCHLDGPIFCFIKVLGVDAFYVAHLGALSLILSSVLSIVTFFCAAMLYANQCLKFQRASYDFSHWRDWFGKVSFSLKQVPLIAGALIQAAMFQYPLFSLPWLAVLGAFRWVILAGVVFVWKQLFGNANEKMYEQSGLTTLFQMASSPCYSNLLMSVSADRKDKEDTQVILGSHNNGP